MKDVSTRPLWLDENNMFVPTPRLAAFPRSAYGCDKIDRASQTDHGRRRYLKMSRDILSRNVFSTVLFPVFLFHVRETFSDKNCFVV